MIQTNEKTAFSETKNKLHKQIDHCQFWNNGTSKYFVELMYLVEATKFELFFGSLNEWSPKRGIFEILRLVLLKILRI